MMNVEIQGAFVEWSLTMRQRLLSHGNPNRRSGLPRVPRTVSSPQILSILCILFFIILKLLMSLELFQGYKV